MNDDWSYIRTVQLLAQTGHVTYNGWATAMLGWQLYFALIFVKLFGFSFTVVRSSMMVIGMATAFLMQRTFVRAGLREWNATLGTLTIVLSPLFLPLTFSFMTDISGLFSIVICLYACLRALEADDAQSQAKTISWIIVAVATSALGGTVRQIAWLGFLVMVPSTLWLLRRHRRVLWSGAAAYIAGLATIGLSLLWFQHQPYSVPEHILQGSLGIANAVSVAQNFVRLAFDAPLFLLPLLLLFVLVAPSFGRVARLRFSLGAACAILFALVQGQRHKLIFWLAPYLGNYVTVYGLVDGTPLHSPRPIVLEFAVRLLITGAAIAGILALFATLRTSFKTPFHVPETTAQPSSQTLAILLGPFTLAYLGLLLPRAAYGELFDRYLLPLLMLAALALLRYYQARVRPNVPAISLILLLPVAAFSVAGTHDTFAMYRARLAAIHEITSTGVPPTALDGGFEYNGWTQIETSGYINDPRIQNPQDAYHPPQTTLPTLCTPFLTKLLPAVVPRFTLAFDPGVCFGATAFAPITYRTWLGPPITTLYIVNATPAPPAQLLP